MGTGRSGYYTLNEFNARKQMVQQLVLESDPVKLKLFVLRLTETERRSLIERIKQNYKRKENILKKRLQWQLMSKDLFFYLGRKGKGVGEFCKLSATNTNGK